ncbi:MULTISPECIES: sterol desaturase family protein [unclassified Tenacibaculum]|uniref:sterol desaturase family protein n=1 Tax=unclassified Tenacibaculum TaxID=2635139 RepID=UPI001F1D478A|nr:MULTISPECIES: sterol desaturase family protein [unclassified Tenacibaculum]MCF2873431.1 sterol desaturase family protein [Tenacibaculum sp. Cn5-1]MCF2933587.1 sterol desaturase family protein [Tenacibaculum sp. Cn5-34]MCG7509831.1 sterol desaturase family protein [Tenacibaculum sp. Cn5-46]
MSLFYENPLVLQLIVYAFIIFFFWGLELVLFSQQIKQKALHSLLNAKFIIFVLPVQIGLSTIVFMVANWTVKEKWGLLYQLPLEEFSILHFIVAFICIDFFDYWYHVMMHRVPLFWRFHQIHHSDMDVDISTTVREHPGETTVRVSFLIAIVFVLGVPVEFLLIKQFIQSFINLTSHSKAKLPEKVNNIVSLLFVTPNTHHIHHHYVLPQTDSNYGDIFSIWDRLFSTFSKMKQSDIVHGIDTNMDVEENKDFKNLITRPFDENREHSTNPIYKKVKLKTVK